MRVRWFPFAAGLVLLGAALAVLATGLRPPDAAFQDRALMYATVLVGLAAVAELIVRGLRSPARATLPRPASGDRVRTPGDDLDEQWREGDVTPLRRRARDAAAATLARRRGWARAEAEQRLREGAWTSDERAAAFLREDADAWSLPRWLLARVRDEPPERERAARATAALCRREGDDP